MKTYSCRYCGGQIIFRTLRSVTENVLLPKPHVRGRVIPIHIDGGCQLRLGLN
jgi:hypothetical protein